MRRGALSQGARQSGLRLESLLANEYQHRWRAHAQRITAGRVNKLAVATVLSLHLNNYPQRESDISILPGALDDTIRRAFAGDGISRSRLEAIIVAFGMAPTHRNELLGLWDGTLQARGRGVAGVLGRVGSSVAREFETVQLQEMHYLGPDGRPARHRTVQQIRSLVDGLEHYRYLFDTQEATVERVHGGVPGEPVHVEGSIWAVDIQLAAPLMTGRTAALEFVTNFHYSGYVEPVFRRAAHDRIGNVVLRVEFDPNRLPARVWWAEWEDYRPPHDSVLMREAVSLDNEHSVHRHMEYIDRAVVGFVWEFA